MANVLGTTLRITGVSIGAFVLFTAVAAALSAGSPLMAIGLIVGSMLLYWTWTYRDETESAAETAEKVGEEATGFFGGIVDWLTAAALSVGFVAISVGGGIFDLVDMLTQIFWAEPITASTALVGGLLAYGAATGNELVMLIETINGEPGIQTSEWIVVAAALTVVAVIARRVKYGKARDR